MKSSQLPKGYKKTEIGVIPEGWGVEAFQNVAILERGKFTARPRNDPKYYGGDIPFIQTGDVTNSNGTINRFSQTLNQEGLKVSKLFKAGTLFFTIAANIGDVGFTSFDTACPDSLIAINPNKDINKYWLFHELKSRKKSFESLATHNAQLNINLEKLRPYLLPIPPVSEQEAIAQALSDTDALIGSLEQLIAKKRHIKQGAMQELLRPKEEWVENRLDELFHISAGGDLRKDEFSQTQDESHPFPIYSNALSEYGLYGYCATKDYSGNCITITARGSTGHAIARSDNFAAIGRLLILEPIDNTNCMFGAEYINLWIDFANESTGVPQLTAPQASKYVLRLPNLTEQFRIATILSDMDTAIAVLEEKLTKTRQLKQGMMHQLLTGRIRLVD